MAVKKNTSDLLAQAASTLPDNTTQQITPQDSREMSENIAFSSFNKITDTALVGLKEYSTIPTYEAGQGCINGGSIYISNKVTGPGVFAPADWDILTTITPAQAAAITANTAKVTNATHTGEVTGSGALTVQPTLISGKTVKSTLAGTEEILVNDGGTFKKVLASNFEGDTIFTGGTMSADSTIAMAGNDLTFDGGKTTLKGSGSTSATTVFKCINSSTNGLFTVLDDGKVLCGRGTPLTNLDVSGEAPIIRLTDTRQNGSGQWDDVTLGALQFYTQDTSAPGARVMSEIEAYSNDQAASGPNSELRFKTSTNLDSSPSVKMVIDQNGGVGIGLTAPTAKLHVKGSGSTSATTALLVQNSLGVDLLEVKDDGYGFFKGSLGVGTLTPALSNSLIVKANNGGESVIFKTSDTQTELFLRDAASNTTLIKLDTNGDSFFANNGNLGVGTSTPSSLLTIQSSTPNSSDPLTIRSDSGGESFIFRNTNSESKLFLRDAISNISVIKLDTNGDNFFNNSGNFGIGLAAPTAKLHVNGSTRFDGSISVNGNAGFTGAGAYTNFTIENGIITAAS